ncbi:MAG: DUF4342 domain-containing protein [Cyanobacteria bacterium J06598_3]
MSADIHSEKFKGESEGVELKTSPDTSPLPGLHADSFQRLKSAYAKGALSSLEARSDGFVVENLKISGEALMRELTDLIGQGNVHRIVIKNKEGHTLLSVPTTLNAMGSSISSILSAEATAIGVIGAIVPFPKVVVEKFG